MVLWLESFSQCLLPWSRSTSSVFTAAKELTDTEEQHQDSLRISLYKYPAAEQGLLVLTEILTGIEIDWDCCNFEQMSLKSMLQNAKFYSCDRWS